MDIIFWILLFFMMIVEIILAITGIMVFIKMLKE